MVVFFAVVPVLRAGEVFAVAFVVPAEDDFAAAFVPEDFAAAVDFVPLDFVPDDLVAVDFVPVDFAAVDFVPVDLVPVDFAPVDLVPVDFAPVDFVPVDFAPVDFVSVDFAPVDLVPVDFAAAVDLVPVDFAAVDFAPVDFAVEEVFAVDAFAALDFAVLDLAVLDLVVLDFAVPDLVVPDLVPVDFAALDFAVLDFVPADPVVLFGAVLAAAPFAVVLPADVPRAVVVPPRAVVVRVRLVVVRVDVGRVADVRDDVCAPAPRAVVAEVRFAGVVFGSFRAPLTTSLNVVPARKAGTLVFFTRTVSPVRGFRAVRAARARFSNTPKPVMFTFSPLFTVRMMMSTRLSTASDATFLSPKRSESASMSWALLAIPVLQEELRVTRPHRPTCAHGITNTA